MASGLHHEQLLQSWREEQHDIASRVVVPESSFATSHPASNIAQTCERYAQLSPCFDNGETEGEKNYLLIGGVDVSFPAVDEEANEDAVAVYVILKYDTSTSSNNNHHHRSGVVSSSSNQPPEVVYRSHKFYKLTTPYIPSYLAFREIDPLLELIAQQRKIKPHLTPNVILVDGNGQWHDRYAGLACFVGVKSGIPTVGVGKTFYCLDNEMKKNDVVGDVKQGVQCWYDEHCKQQADLLSTVVVDKESIPYSTNVEVEKESSYQVAYEDMLVAMHQVCSGLAIPMRSGKKKNDSILAYALVGHGGNNPNNNNGNASKKKNESARGSKNPIYISCGSHISLLDAVSIVAWTSIVRIPEPIREADLHGRQLLRDQKN